MTVEIKQHCLGFVSESNDIWLTIDIGTTSGVQLHHHYASRFLIDTLHKHGFCCSYNEVHQFEQNAVLSQFVQYVADNINVDHNIKTLDGNNACHGMGMIAAVTPANNNSNQILRVKVTPKDIAAIGRVLMQFGSNLSLI